MLIIFGFTSKFHNVAMLVIVDIQFLVIGFSYCCLYISTRSGAVVCQAQLFLLSYYMGNSTAI